jgi:hypothetical protein
MLSEAVLADAHPHGTDELATVAQQHMRAAAPAGDGLTFFFLRHSGWPCPVNCGKQKLRVHVKLDRRHGCSLEAGAASQLPWPQGMIIYMGGGHACRLRLIIRRMNYSRISWHVRFTYVI